MTLQTVRSGRPVSFADAPAAIERRYVPEPNSGCWLWVGHVDTKLGYGRLVISGKRRVAHRVSYEALIGRIPDGLQLDHLCRVRCCVNPAHLEPVSQQENIRRGKGIPVVNAAKTHCIHGHEFNAKNTIICRNGRSRKCRKCHDLRNSKRYTGR